MTARTEHAKTPACLAVAAAVASLALGPPCPAQGSPEPSRPRMLELRGDLRVHDPAVIREGKTYFLFSTGRSRRDGGIIPIRCSPDLRAWRRCGSVFTRLPEWAGKEIAGARAAWAPDIARFNGRFHLYYSVSSFGKNSSAIGLATNKTLDPASPEYKWIDRGMVVRSTQGKDDWNAIDANVVLGDKKNVWLCWGSFWSGIKMRRIDPRTGLLSSEDSTLHSLACRPPESVSGTDGTPRAVEAPFIVKREGFWFLFVSFDLCCRGARSTYKIMVGRSGTVTGPYEDAGGRSMMDGGGTLLLKATTPRWRGPGHCAVVADAGGGDYLVFHAYHGRTGRPELKISTISWADGWPHVARLP